MKKIRFEEQVLYGNAKILNVLLVVDHAGTRLKLATILKKYFSQVNVCRYASEALIEFTKSKFDLVIIEHYLSDMRGSEISEQIKLIASKKPIIIISNKSEASELIELINIGIDGFIKVPLNKADIISILTRVTNNISDLTMLYKSFDLSNFVDIQDKKVKEAKVKEAEVNYVEESIDTLFQNLSSLSALELIDAYPTDLELTGDRLLQITEDIDFAVNKFLSHSTKENALAISLVFERFSLILSNIPIFSNIEIATKKLSYVFDNVDCSRSYEDYSEILFLVLDGLVKWCNEIFIDKTSPNIYYMDKSILADSLSVSNLFLEVYEDSTEDEIEFF